MNRPTQLAKGAGGRHDPRMPSPSTASFLMRAHFGASLSIPLGSERSQIGRSAACDIRIDEPGMPPVMGIVVHSMGEHFLVADSEDRPFMVNGHACARKVLLPGDTVAFAQCELEFGVGSAPPQAAPEDLEDQLALMALAGTAPPHAHAASVPSHPPAAAAHALSTPSTWPEKAWGKLVPIHGPAREELLLTASLAMVDLGAGRATLSRRKGQCFATLVSGVVFCSKERLGPKPKELSDNALVASGGQVYMLRLALSGT